MNRKILVAYATRYGSTQQVAEQVAATLRDCGLAADLSPMRQVSSLDGYRAVVLGTPIYMGHWHKDTNIFLSRYREALTGGLPVAIFAGGPITKGDEKEWQEVRKQLDQELAKFAWLAPIAVEIVAGRFDPAKLHLSDRLIAGLPASPLHGMPASDLRDWKAIRAWASNLAEKLQPALAQ